MPASLTLDAVATHRLDAPLTADAALTPDGRHLVAVTPARRLVRLTLDPARCAVAVRDTGVRLPLPPAKAGRRPRFVQGVDDRGATVVLRDHAAAACVVRALPSGAVRARVPWAYGAALSPDGRWWLRMRRPPRPTDPWIHLHDTRTGAAHDVTDRWLDAQGQVWMDTRNFAEEDHPTPEERARRTLQGRADAPDADPDDGALARQIDVERRKQAAVDARWATPEPLFLDQPDAVVMRAAPGERVEVFMGCYGFVWRALAEPDAGGLLARVVEPGSDLVFSDVVYDPVDVVAPAGTRYVLARHGYGSGLLAMDSARRRSYAFPVRDVLPRPGYGAIQAAAAGIGTDACAVQTRAGAFLWRPGTPPVALPVRAHAPVAVWEGVLLTRDPPGTTLTWHRWSLPA